eukprot:2925635-Rhodomonas_salina.2
MEARQTTATEARQRERAEMEPDTRTIASRRRRGGESSKEKCKLSGLTEGRLAGTAGKAEGQRRAGRLHGG